MHGLLIKEILNKYNITQQELADKLNITKQFMSDIRRDKSKIPKSKFDVLVKKYNVNVFYLLMGEGAFFNSGDGEKEVKLVEKLTTEELNFLKTSPELEANTENNKKLLSILKKTNMKIVSASEFLSKPKNTFEIKYEPCAEQLKEFGKRLNKLRINADMITREISMLLEINEDRFSDLCVGKKEPTLAEIVRICENFEVTADWLLFGKE